MSAEAKKQPKYFVCFLRLRKLVPSRKCFRPIGIYELRGLEFHQWTQGEQQLGRKAFPSIGGNDFDR